MFNAYLQALSNLTPNAWSEMLFRYSRPTILCQECTQVFVISGTPEQMHIKAFNFLKLIDYSTAIIPIKKTKQTKKQQNLCSIIFKGRSDDIRATGSGTQNGLSEHPRHAWDRATALAASY